MGTNGSPQGHGPPSEPLPPGHADSSGDAHGSPSDPGPLRNQGTRAPGLAHTGNGTVRHQAAPDCPSPAQATPARPRPGRGRSRAAARRYRGDVPTWPWQESAEEGRAHTMPTSRRLGRGGAGRSGSRPSARRWPGAAAAGAGRPSGVRDSIPPGPGRGHQPGRCAHQRRTPTTPGLGSQGTWPAPRPADAGGTAGLVPGHAARRRRPRCGRRVRGPGRRQTTLAARRAAASARCPRHRTRWPHACRPGERKARPQARQHHGHRPRTQLDRAVAGAQAAGQPG